MIAASVLVWLLLLDGTLGPLDGLLLSLLLLGYLVFSYYSADENDAEAIEAGPRNPLLSVAFIVVGIGCLVGGGVLFVDGAVALARAFGITEVVIGLTIIAIGTSMPELVTSMVAAIKGQSDIAIGNVVGSNLFNLLGILGITALVHPVSAAGFSILDFSVMLLLAILLLPLAHRGYRIGRRDGLLLLLAYLAYMGWLVTHAMV